MADQLFDGPDGHSLDRLASSQTLLYTPAGWRPLWPRKNLTRCPKLVDHYPLKTAQSSVSVGFDSFACSQEVGARPMKLGLLATVLVLKNQPHWVQGWASVHAGRSLMLAAANHRHSTLPELAAKIVGNQYK
ncbi:hypothetical protein ACIOZM_10585 [Pseudomonas sp. NPDC087346]|uniref:hypothetical protein n=1 Tax=Pseudomonas sp. NPDC087346 TaxID=3364438 RepID=UPI00380D2E61